MPSFIAPEYLVVYDFLLYETWCQMWTFDILEDLPSHLTHVRLVVDIGKL